MIYDLLLSSAKVVQGKNVFNIIMKDDDEGELAFLHAGPLEDLLDGRQLLVPDDWDLTLTSRTP